MSTLHHLETFMKSESTSLPVHNSFKDIILLYRTFFFSALLGTMFLIPHLTTYEQQHLTGPYIYRLDHVDYIHGHDRKKLPSN